MRVGPLAALGLAAAIACAGGTAQACELVIYASPRPPVSPETIATGGGTVVQGRVTPVEEAGLFDAWGGTGIRWRVDLALTTPDAGDLPQPTTVSWSNSPCGPPLPRPRPGETYRLVLSPGTGGWHVVDTITKADLIRFLAWRRRTGADASLQD